MKANKDKDHFYRDKRSGSVPTIHLTDESHAMKLVNQHLNPTSNQPRDPTLCYLDVIPDFWGLSGKIIPLEKQSLVASKRNKPTKKPSSPRKKNNYTAVRNDVLTMIHQDWSYFPRLRGSVKDVTDLRLVEIYFLFYYGYNYYFYPTFAQLIEEKIQLLFPFEIKVGLISKDLRNGRYRDGVRIPEPDDHYDYRQANLMNILEELLKMIIESRSIHNELKYHQQHGKNGYDSFEDNIFKLTQFIKKIIYDHDPGNHLAWNPELLLCENILSFKLPPSPGYSFFTTPTSGVKSTSLAPKLN